MGLPSPPMGRSTAERILRWRSESWALNWVKDRLLPANLCWTWKTTLADANKHNSRRTTNPITKTTNPRLFRSISQQFNSIMYYLQLGLFESKTNEQIVSNVCVYIHFLKLTYLLVLSKKIQLETKKTRLEGADWRSKAQWDEESRNI